MLLQVKNGAPQDCIHYLQINSTHNILIINLIESNLFNKKSPQLKATLNTMKIIISLIVDKTQRKYFLELRSRFFLFYGKFSDKIRFKPYFYDVVDETNLYLLVKSNFCRDLYNMARQYINLCLTSLLFISMSRNVHHQWPIESNWSGMINFVPSIMWLTKFHLIKLQRYTVWNEGFLMGWMP